MLRAHPDGRWATVRDGLLVLGETMIALVTSNSSEVPLIQGLCSSILHGFEFSVLRIKLGFQHPRKNDSVLLLSLCHEK